MELNHPINWISAIGLVLDFFGALLLIQYGLPSKIESEEGAGIQSPLFPEELATIMAKNDKIRFRSKIGIVLLTVGFALQLLGTIVKIH